MEGISTQSGGAVPGTAVATRCQLAKLENGRVVWSEPWAYLLLVLVRATALALVRQEVSRSISWRMCDSFLASNRLPQHRFGARVTLVRAGGTETANLFSPRTDSLCSP